MKKIITLALLMCTITLVNSQNNLVFNQVINIRLLANQSVTIPEGKVWKIENSSGENLSLSSNSEPYPGTASLNNGYIDGTANGMIVWLSEGISFSGNTNSDTLLSILEFNVVPTSSSVTSNSGFTGVSSHIDTYYFNEEFIISNAEGGRIKDLNSITVPEGQIWKVIYAFRTVFAPGNDYPYSNSLSDDAVIIDEMLFKDERRNEFWLDSGEHSVKFSATSANDKNKIVIKALIYDIN